MAVVQLVISRIDGPFPPVSRESQKGSYSYRQTLIDAIKHTVDSVDTLYPLLFSVVGSGLRAQVENERWELVFQKYDGSLARPHDMFFL